MNTMLLHAQRIDFEDPITSEKITITAPLQAEFERMLTALLAIN